MPRGDGTGPMGMGPMTGRGAGFCTGYAQTAGGFTGYGCGRGFRNMSFATGTPCWNCFNRFNAGNAYSPSAIDEKELLSRQAKLLEDQLDEVNKRLSSID